MLEEEAWGIFLLHALVGEAGQVFCFSLHSPQCQPPVLGESGVGLLAFPTPATPYIIPIPLPLCLHPHGRGFLIPPL